jgi:immune inhibitor A
MHHHPPTSRNTENPLKKKSLPGLVAGTACLALGLAALPAAAVPSDGAPAPSDSGSSASRPDNLPNPFARKQTKLRKKAIELLVNGKAEAEPQRGGGSVVTLANGEAVEFPDAKKEARVWTVLSEFGEESSGRYGRGAGPVRNQIAPPDRDLDNTTQWTDDFNVAHYDEMFNGEGESFKNYYLDQSNGEYNPTVTTEDWVTVPKNGAWYGDNANETQGYWTYVADTVNAWYDKQLAAGKTATEIDAYLAQFDVWDRYDHDGDSNFNEPDGYIDHFQAIHAGEGEEAGGGTLGDDAIWSHRWYADYTTQGSAGPEGNLLGGKRIGQSKFWIGDYTIEPENGGLGVFAHEYAHDLGLPDFYDTAGGENGSAFWTLMSSGSWLGHGDEATGFDVGIGGTPNDMGPEEKLFLGWLDTQTAAAGTSGDFTLRPTGDPASNDAVLVNLPDAVDSKQLTTPYSGEHSWYSGSRSDLTATLTRQVPAASSVTVTAQTWYATEAGYDYWWAEYRPVGATGWTRIGQAIDGASRSWTSKRFSYRPGNQPTEFRFVYKTDGGVNEAGLFLDEIVTKAGQQVLDTEGAETEASAWTASQFTKSNGTATTTGARYYLLENRSYVNYDDTLRTGPYNFSEGVTRPNWVEHFSYQDGMLVWLVDHSVPDNNTSEHPGTAYALPIDANPAALTWSDGSLGRSRIQVFDATFGTQTTDVLKLSRQVSETSSQTLEAPARPGVATFDDTLDYYNEALPGTSVETVGAGVLATVTGQDANAITVRVANQLP